MLYFPVSSESASSLGDRLREQVCSIPCLLRTTGVRGGASSRDPHPLKHGVHSPSSRAFTRGSPAWGGGRGCRRCRLDDIALFGPETAGDSRPASADAAGPLGVCDLAERPPPNLDPGSHIQQGDLPDHDGRGQLLRPLLPGLPAHPPVALSPAGHQHGAGLGLPGPPPSAGGAAGEPQGVLDEALL